jgi:hypothetical protein
LANELITGADSRPRLHIWPAAGEPFQRYSLGATGRRFEGMEALHDTVALAVYSMAGRLDKGAIIVIEKSDQPTYGKEEDHD